MRGVHFRRAGGRRRRSFPAALALGIAAAAAATAPARAATGSADGGGNGNSFEITVLSSRPDQVSGGDALVEVSVPRSVRVDDVTITVDGVDVTAAFAPDGADDATLVGLVDGLDEGDNTLTAAAAGKGPGRPEDERLTLTNHPIRGPIFSGPQQQPFVCTTARGRLDGRPILDQPLVDNQDHVGIAVAAEDAQGNYPQDGRGYPTADAQIVGWSKDCAVDTRYGYVYGTTGGQFRWLHDPAGPRPADIAPTTNLAGHTVPLILPREPGTN